MSKLGCKVRFTKDAKDMYGMTSKKYNYLTDIEGLQEGDMIVVHVRDSFDIAYFVEYDENVKELENTKWIVIKVDLTAHYERVAKKERVKEIKEKLEKERQKAEELQIYEILAAANPKMKELLDELKSLI